MNLTRIADDSLFFSFLSVFFVVGEKDNPYPQVVIISSITFPQMFVIPAGINNNILNRLPKLVVYSTVPELTLKHLHLVYDQLRA